MCSSDLCGLFTGGDETQQGGDGENGDQFHDPILPEPCPGVRLTQGLTASLPKPCLDRAACAWPLRRLMKTADFDFDLPDDNIALRPAEPRDSARLLVVRQDGLEDRIIRDLPDFLRPGDALVFNDTRVIPARLSGVRERANPVVGGPDGDTLTVEVEATQIGRAHV